MRFILKRIGLALVVFIFFVLMTVAFYHGMGLLDQFLEHGNNYQGPSNGAVSVTSDLQSIRSGERNGSGQFAGWRRILEFIRDGE
jgi:hypothetical protein